MDHPEQMKNPVYKDKMDGDLIPKVSGIYVIFNKIDGKIYVGSASECRRRKRHHLAGLMKNKHHCAYLQNAWNKHGENSFEFLILEIAEENKLQEREQWYFDNYKCDYNMCKTAYSPIGIKRRPETIEKMKKSAQKGDFHWTRRNGMSVETKSRMSIARKQFHANNKLPWVGKKLSQERIDKMTAGRVRAIVQLTLEGEPIREWSSAEEAANTLSIHASNITRVCKGKAMTTAGYKWKYTDKSLD